MKNKKMKNVIYFHILHFSFKKVVSLFTILFPLHHFVIARRDYFGNDRCRNRNYIFHVVRFF